MIRVLHVLGGLYAGGMESMIMNYYRNIDKDLIQFDFLVFSDKAFFDDEVLALGGRIFRITPRRVNPIMNYKELDVFFRENTTYRIVHIHQGINYFAPLAKAFKYNLPIRIVHSHGMSPKLIKKQGVLFDLFTKPLIDKLGTHFLACSEYAAKQIFTPSCIANKNYALLRNAIDTDKFKLDSEKRTEMRKKLKLEGKFVVGHVGNFTYPKNHKFIIDVFSQIHTAMKESCLVLVGDGPEMDHIKQQVNKYGLCDEVLFLGTRDDVHEVMNTFDRFIFPSHYEGLPVSLIEAQACGIKCYVSSNITKEVKITNLLEYIDLSKSAKFWACEILSNGDFIKSNDLNEVVGQSGYDVKKQAKWLEWYYDFILNQS